MSPSSSLQRFPSLQYFSRVSMLYLTSTPPFTSMLFLGFNALSHFNASFYFNAFPRLQCLISLQCFPSLRRRGHIECDPVFFNVSLNLTWTLAFTSRLISMPYFTSTPPFTSMLCLGFNALSHFNASLHFDAEVTSSVTLCFLMSLSISLQRFPSLQYFS